jgi:ABC-2 type transport system permease protein
MFSREVILLYKKELRQLTRNKGALATSLVLPLFLMVGLPLFISTITGAHPGTSAKHGGEIPAWLPGLRDLGADPTAGMLRVILPIFVAITALVAPTVSASYALVQERESRTLDLLIALPVRVGQILLAKLMAIVTLAGGATGALFIVDAAIALHRGAGGPGWVAGLFLVLLGALSFSTASALLISLLAKDYRAAQSITGFLIAPSLILTSVMNLFVPGPPALRLVCLAALFFAMAAGGLAIALRVVTFERLLR